MPRRRPAHRHPGDGKVLAAADNATGTGPEGTSADGGLPAHELARLRASLEWAAQQGFMELHHDSLPQSAQPEPESPAAAVATPPPAGATRMSAERPSADDPVGEGNMPSRALPADAPEATARQTMSPNGEPTSCGIAVRAPAVDWRAIADDGTDYLTALGRQRSTTIGLPAAEALRAMALFYLAHGLYREALATSEAIAPAPAHLRDAALILLGRGDEAGNTLLDLARCRPDGPLWTAALLAARGQTEALGETGAKRVDALTGFPRHPRTVLALALAEAALKTEAVERASSLLEFADPAADQATAGMIKLLHGRIALERGQQDRAAWYFAEAASVSSEARRQSQIVQIRRALAQGTAPPPGASDILRGALFDFRGSRELLPAALLSADLHAEAGDFNSALVDLSAAAHRLPAETDAGPLRAKAREILRQALTVPDAVDDAMALQLFDDHHHFLENDDGSRAIHRALARRMLAAGLPSAAARILEPDTASAPLNPEIAALMAETALRTNRPDAALELLAQSPDPDSTVMRQLKRQALIQLGRYAEAASLEAGSGSRTAAAMNWAAADWTGATEAYAEFLANADADAVSPEDGIEALRALAAASMSGDTTLPPPLTAKAIRMAENAGLAEAAAALTSPPPTDGLTLPDAVTAVLEHSRQVRALFPTRQP